MEDKILSKISELLKKERLTKKAIYENLLSEQVIRPNSDALVFEIIDYGLENGLLSQNQIISYRKKRGKLPDIFSTEQLIKVFDTVDRPKLAICLWLGFFCGLRIREVCNLTVDDIDLQNKTIFIRNSKNTNRVKEGYGKDRIVSIPDIAISPIKKWLDIIQGGKWFIPSMQDPYKPIRTKTIHEQYRFLLDRCSLSAKDHVTEYRAKNHGKKKDMKKSTYKFRFHTLRHTYASYLLDKGVPIENIQRSLGHNQIDTTMIYAKVRDSKTRQFINEAFNTPMRLVNNQINYKQPTITTHQDNISAEEILKQRLARGEIDLISYRRLYTELNNLNL